MKILVLTVTILNLAACFPYNGNQETHSQTNHLSANPPLPASESHTASQLSSILRTENNSAPTDDPNSYSESPDTVTRQSGSLSKRNYSETFQASIYNFPPLGNDVPSNPSATQTSASFAYIEGIEGNYTQAESPMSNVSPSSAAMQDTSAVSITISRFAPNSAITQSRMAVSGENNISAPVSITTHQYKSDSTAIPHYRRDSKATQSLEPFFPSTGRSKPFFGSNPASHRRNTKTEFSASADESNTAISNTNNLLGTYTTTREREARPESIYFIGTTTLTKEGNTATINAIDILKEYTTLFDVPDMEDETVIITDTSYLERDGKTMSNAPAVPQKDNSIVIDATDKKNHHRTIVNAQTPSIFFAKNTNDVESFPILSTHNKADTKSSTTATDADEATSSINPATNSFLNYRRYKKSNNVINNFNDTKTMLDVAKNTKHAGDLIISKTNGITSTKHYANPNATAPTTNTNINFKITWPLKEDTIVEGRHPVQIENTRAPNNNNIAEATGFKLNDSVIEFHSNIPASVHLKPDMDYFKYVSNDEIEEGIPVVQQIANMDQDDVVIEEVILLHPDTSTTEMRRKMYFLNPDADYGQTAENKIIFLSEIPGMFNPLFKNKIMPFTTDGINLIKNRDDHRTPTTITANDAKAKMDVGKTSVFKMANLQSNITPVITHPGTSRTIYFHEDSVDDVTSASKLRMTPSDKSTDSVDETISLSTSNNYASSDRGPKPETTFPMNKEYTLQSVAKSSTLMPKAQNNQAQNSLLIKDDSLADAWISDSVAKNPHLINAIIQKWKINKVSVDPSNIPLESIFLIPDFTSPTDEYSTGKRTTNMIANSELMLNKATIPEGRPTTALNSLAAKTAGILTQKQRFGSLIDKERTNEEESTPYMEVKSALGEDGNFQIKEDLLPAQLSSGFERNGFAAVDSTKSLSKLSSSIPTTEVTVSSRGLTTPGEENVDVLYDITKPSNGKIHFKTIATKATVNGLGKSAAVKQNMEAADGTEYLPTSNSVLQSRKDHPILSNLYYHVITDNPLTITTENPNVAQNTMQHKWSLFAMDKADLTDYRNDYQALAAITSSNAKRLINKGKMAGMEITNIPPGSPAIVNDISNEDKNTDAVTDLASTVFTSPIMKGILIKNEVNALNNKPNKLKDDFTISRGDPRASADDGMLLVADSSAFMQSVDPFNHPHATNSIKKISLADIIIPKTFHNKSSPAALTGAVTAASQGDADAMLYGTRYESKHPFKEDVTVNSETHPQNDTGITAKEDGLKVENVMGNIYVTPTAGGNVPKGKNLTAKHHSLHSDVYNSTRFKETTKTTADQLEFENPASSYMTEVSKSLLRKFTPEFQGRVIVRNSNTDAEHDPFFGGDILYPMMKENVPKGSIFSSERRSTFITPDFRIPMKDNTNSAPEGTVLLGKGTSHTNYASYTAEQSDPGTEKDQTTTESTTNSHTGIIPMTFSIPIPSEDTNVKNYYHISGTGTPLSSGYANTLRDDSYIPRPETTLRTENNLDAMDLIITEPNKSDSEYISNKHSFELEKEETSSIKRPIPSIHGPNGLVSHSVSPKGGASKSLLYRITHPEFETEEEYQVIILKEENSDSDILATSFKDYTKNFNTQHLKTKAPSLMDATETFSTEFLERSSVGEETLSKDDAIIILPEITDLGSKTIKYLFVPYTETIVTTGENTFGTVPTGHAEITIPIKSQGHPYNKGISSNVGNTSAPELADTIKSEKSKVNENKSDLAGKRQTGSTEDQMLISRKRNPDSDKDGTFPKDYTVKFKSKSPRITTHLLTDGTRKVSSEFPDDLSLEKDTLSGNDIIITLPEGKWIEHISTPDPESMEIMGESKMFPEEITDLTMTTTPITNKGQLYRKYIKFIAPYYQRKPEMSPRSEYNQDKHFKAESYHSWNAIDPSTAFSLSLDNNELPFVGGNSGNKKNRASMFSSPMRTTHTVADTTALSLENSYKGGNSMQPDEDNVRSNEFPSLLTSERIILMPKVLTKDSVLMSDNSLTDPSKSVSVASETGIEYLDFIHGNDISENQDIKIQTDLQPHLLNSNIPSNDSVTFTRNSTDDDTDSVPTAEKETVNISEVNTDAQPLSAMMKVLLNPFPSEIKKMAELSAEEDKTAKFDLNHITSATVLIPTLENTLPSIPEPNALSKTNNKEEKHSISEAGNFVSRDSGTLNDNPFFGKFNISQAPPNLKRTLSADSTISLEKTLKPKYKNSAPPKEDAGTAGLLHNAPTGSDVLLQKSILSPGFTSVSSCNYSELDPVVKMKKYTTTNTFNNIPFEERNTPSHKAITSPSTNTSTKGMVNTIFNKRFVHRNSLGKDIITEYEIIPITENISDITLDGENISNIEDAINTMPDNRALENAINEYVLEPQEEKYNAIIKKTTFIYDPKIVGSHQIYSSADTSEHLSQGNPTEIKTKEILQNLVSRKEHTSSDLDAIVLKSSNDNLNSQAPRSVTHPLTHESESILKFLGKTTLKRDTLQDDTINIFPEDKVMEYTLVPDPEIIVTMAEGRIFPDEPTYPIAITSPLKNKNQFFKKVISSTIYNTDDQSKAENILLSQADNVKGKTNMAEMQHSWESIISLAEFNVIPKGKLSFISEDTEILNKKASISSLPMNTVNPEDKTTTPFTKSSYERGDSMLPEDNIRSRGFLPLQIPEKAIFIPNVSTENLEISDPVTNTSLANFPIALSNAFKTMIEYPNSINDSDSPIKNKTDLKPYSLISTKLPIGSTTFSDNPTNNEFESMTSAIHTTDGSKTETGKIYFKPQRKIMKAFSPIKVSQQRVPEERKIADFSDQEDPAAKSDLSYITNATILRNANILSPAMKKILPPVTEHITLYKSDNNVEGEVHISTDNFFPKDASTLKDKSFTVEFDPAATKPQAPPNLKGIFPAGSTLPLPEASRSNDQSSSPDVAIWERTITNTPTGTYGLPPWKLTLLPSDSTTFMSSSKYSELDHGIKMKKDITTKTNNNIPPGERNTPSNKSIISPTIILSKKGMKNPINTINNNKFGDETFIGKDISTEVVSFTEDISEEAHDILWAEENIPSDDNIVTIIPDDSDLDYVADNYVEENIPSDNIVTIIPDDSDLDYVADNYVFELMRERNGALRRMTTLGNDSNVFKSHSPYASAAVSENASQGSLTDIKTTKKQQIFIPKNKNLNSDDDATVLKSSPVNFNTKVPRSMVYSLTDLSWILLPEFLNETTVENSSPIGDNTIIILPKSKKMESPFVPDPELIIRMGESKIFTTNSIDPAVITYPIEYKDQFNRKGVSFALYNHDSPNEAKTTLSAKFNANKYKPDLADMPHSQNNNIIPLAEFNVIPDDDLPFIGKNTEKANRALIFSSSMNKAASTVADSVVLSTEGSYEGSDSMLPGENVKSRGFSSPLTSATLIPNSLPENPETSGLIIDKSLSESVKNKSGISERATEYADAINGGDVSERQVIISQADIPSYPLAWNISPIRSTTFSDSTTDGEVDSFFSLNRDTRENYKTKTDKIYSNSQRATMKDLSIREDSQDSVYERRKIANLFDQEDPTAKLELHNFPTTTVFIPAIRKILPSGTEPNHLSKGDSNMEDSFTAKFNATSYKPQTPLNLKGIFLADSTLTLAEDVRPTSHDKVTNTGGSITNTPSRLYSLQWRSTFSPSDFTTSMGTSKYSDLVPVTSTGKDMTKEIDYSILHEKIIIPSDKAIISPIITSEKDMASILQRNISEQKDLMKSRTAGEYGITYFTEDTSERVDDLSSADRITPAYLDHTTMTSDDSGSEYVSDMHASVDRANNSLIKMGTLIYAPKIDVSHAPYTTFAAPDSLPKTTSPVFKAKENYQPMIPRQENSTDTEAIALKNSDANVNAKAHRPTTHFLIDASINFPSSFSDKISVGKSTINGDDDTKIPSEGFDLENKITKYSLSPDIKPIVDSKTFTTDTTNHAFKNSDNFLKRNTSPTIYKTFTVRRADDTTSSISDFTEDQTGTATVSDSRFSNFPLAQLSSEDISNVKENTEDAINTALTFFYPLKKMSANVPYAPAISTKNKNNIGRYNLPSLESVRSLRLASMGLPEILILTSKDPTKETAAPKLIKGTNIYYPIVLISAASEPLSIDSPYFNKGIAPEGQNTRSQRVPKAFPLVYTILQADSTGSSDNMANIDMNPTATTVTKSKIFDINAFGDQNSEPKKTTTKFSTLFPNEYSKPNFYYTKEITKASAVKDTAEVNHLTNVNRIIGNDAVIQVETNSLKDANLKPYLVNKNIVADNKSGNKDDDIVPVAAYSSFHKPKNFLPDGYVPQETYFINRNSNLLAEVIDTIPTDEKSLSYTKIISMVEENS